MSSAGLHVLCLPCTATGIQLGCVTWSSIAQLLAKPQEYAFWRVKQSLAFLLGAAEDCMERPRLPVAWEV